MRSGRPFPQRGRAARQGTNTKHGRVTGGRKAMRANDERPKDWREEEKPATEAARQC